MTKVTVGITTGDIAGIGPEIVLKALDNKDIYELCKPVVIGEKSSLKKIIDLYEFDLQINTIDVPREGIYKHGTIDLINMDNIDVSLIEIGKVQAEGGKGAFEFIKKSVELALDKEIDAIATGPISKEALNLAGIDFIGHTEILGELTGTENPLTMFQVYNLKVFFLTRHLSLSNAINKIENDFLVEFIHECNKELVKLGTPQPKVVVSGLNPHNGENGLFGDEEIREIIPAIEKAKNMGIDINGPIPADSVFHQALQGKYDAVISLYHDQGHIATKMVDFEKTIAVTLGLPFIRTSVDHGTAFDIAGKKVASAVSMEESIKLAAAYASIYNK